MKKIYEERGICTPFVDPVSRRIFFGTHKGKVIQSINLDGTMRRVEFHIGQTPCRGHISSPALWGDNLYYHGHCKTGKQRTFMARRDPAGGWDTSDDTIIGYPYFQQFNETTALAKYNGIQFYDLQEGEWHEIYHVHGRFRHCHIHEGQMYYSLIGGDPEIIRRAPLSHGVPRTELSQVVVRPDPDWGPPKPSVLGPAKHRCEVRDPHVFEDKLYFIGEGERAIYETPLS